MGDNKFFQVSTLQALAMGYTKSVITVGKLRAYGSIGLGTFEDVNGEMIMLDGRCFRAMEDGTVMEAPDDMGVPFSAVTMLRDSLRVDLGRIENIEKLNEVLTLRIEEVFGLNSMHVVRIDGVFLKIKARSEAPYKSQHVGLKDVLSLTQKDFEFRDIDGSLVCVYYPDYMDGINAPGWHIHFVSEDRSRGGHVFDIEMSEGSALFNKIDRIEITMPTDPAFDTYSLKEASQEEIKEVEQGK